MNRDELILATLASSGKEFSPVQIQKILFLLDMKAAPWTQGPHFAFKPYDYGPFDPSIYQNLTDLWKRNLVEIQGDPTSKSRGYGLTADGRKEGQRILGQLAAPFSEYLSSLANFVQRLTFAQLVSSIYKAYPNMRENSVFRG